MELAGIFYLLNACSLSLSLTCPLWYGLECPSVLFKNFTIRRWIFFQISAWQKQDRLTFAVAHALEREFGGWIPPSPSQVWVEVFRPPQEDLWKMVHHIVTNIIQAVRLIPYWQISKQPYCWCFYCTTLFYIYFFFYMHLFKLSVYLFVYNKYTGKDTIKKGQ